MNKKIIKDTFSLVLITLIAVICLSFVFELTSKTIDDASRKERLESYRSVFSTADQFKSIDLDLLKDKIELPKGVSIEDAQYTLSNDNETLGCVLSIKSNQGYGGDIILSLGVSEDGTITGMKITQQSESPGFGANCVNDEFTKQFTGKKENVIKNDENQKDENGIDVISSATYTTNAIIDAVNGGTKFAKIIFEQSEGTQP